MRKSKSTPVVIDQSLNPRKSTNSSKWEDSSPNGPISSLVPPPADDHLTIALRRLDIEPEDLELVPKVSDSIAACFGKDPRFPREKVINLLAGSTIPAARAFIETWKTISKKDWDVLPFEAVCLKAQVSPLEVFGAIVLSARDISRQQSALKAILAHPEVVESTVESAKSPLGFMDRKMLHEAVGFLTTKQGSSIAINVNQTTAESKNSENPVEVEEKAWMNSFPRISESLETWSERRRQLSDGKQE